MDTMLKKSQISTWHYSPAKKLSDVIPALDSGLCLLTISRPLEFCLICSELNISAEEQDYLITFWENLSPPQCAEGQEDRMTKDIWALGT